MGRQKKPDGLPLRVRGLRKALGLTQRQFGERLGVNRSTIANLELGRSIPRIPLLRLMCEMFGVSEDWLLRGEGPMLLQKGSYYFRALERDYALSEEDRRLILRYLAMPAEERRGILQGMKALSKIAEEKEKHDEKS